MLRKTGSAIRSGGSLQSPGPALLLASLLLGGIAGLSGCDNPSCVFGPGNCSGGGGGAGGLGSDAAGDPTDGSVMVAGPPSVVWAAPDGDIGPDTPILVAFNESISPDSLIGAFELISSEFGQAVPIIEPPIVLAGGRVAVLLPIASLTAGSYTIAFAEDSRVIDITGQARTGAADIGSFQVLAEPGLAPLLVGTYPRDGDVEQSDLDPIIVAFDRDVEAASVTSDSFLVTVDGAAPTFSVEPEAVVLTGGPIPVPVPRVYSWTHTDATGAVASLGVGAPVVVRLSPEANQIRPEEGEPLAETSIAYDLAAARAPKAVFKSPLSEPANAIGRPNLEDPELPLVFVEFEEPFAAGDNLGVFLFGDSVVSEEEVAQGIEAQAIALYRQIAMTESVDFYEIKAGQLDLVETTIPFVTLLAEGQIEIVVRLETESFQTAVRRFDGDTDADGVQPPLLDTSAPALVGLEIDGSNLGATPFRSDLRNVVLVGLADEAVEEARVTVVGGGQDNLNAEGLAPVIGADQSGRFVTRPIQLGVLDDGQELELRLELFDRAQNQATISTNFFFQQRGLIEVSGVPPTSEVDVFVYDERTLAPVPGASVISDAGIVVTDVNGRASLTSPGAGDMVITVDANLYELYSWVGVLGPALHVPLRRTLETAANTEGVVSGDATLALTDKFVGDSRFPLPGDPLAAVDPCSFGQTVVCAFGPVEVTPSLLGVQSVLAVDFNSAASGFVVPSLFLLGFGFNPIASPVASGVVEEVTLLGSVLVSDPEAAPLPGPGPVVNFSDPASDAWGTTVDPPEVTIEASGPGYARTIPVGLGIADSSLIATGWDGQAAFVGAADGVQDDPEDQLGSLVLAGSIDPDLLFRVELADQNGNRVGVRPRFSSALLEPQAPLNLPILAPLEPPAVRTPAASANLVLAGGAVVFDDSLRSAPPAGQDGLYRVEIRAGNRGWDLWMRRPDPDPGGQVTMTLPDVAGSLGVPLSTGNATIRVVAYGLPRWDAGLARIVYSDIEREFERFGFGAPVDVLLQ